MKSTKRMAPLPPMSKSTKSPPFSNLPQKSSLGRCCCQKSDVTTLLTELRNPNDVLWTLMDKSYEAELNLLNSEKRNQVDMGIEPNKSSKFIMVDTGEELTAVSSPEDMVAKREINNLSPEIKKEVKSTEDEVQGFDQYKTLPSIVKMKPKMTAECEIDSVKEGLPNDACVNNVMNLTSTNNDENAIFQKPELLFSVADVVNKVTEDMVAKREINDPSFEIKKEVKSTEDEDQGFAPYKTLPSIVKMKPKTSAECEIETVNEDLPNDARVNNVFNSNSTNSDENSMFQKPEILFSIDEVVNKVNQTYRKSNYLNLNTNPTHSKRFEKTINENKTEKSPATGTSIIAFIKSMDSMKLNLSTFSSKDRMLMDTNFVDNSVLSKTKVRMGENTLLDSSNLLDTPNGEINNCVEKVLEQNEDNNATDSNISVTEVFQNTEDKTVAMEINSEEFGSGGKNIIAHDIVSKQFESTGDKVIDQKSYEEEFKSTKHNVFDNGIDNEGCLKFATSTHKKDEKYFYPPEDENSTLKCIEHFFESTQNKFVAQECERDGFESLEKTTFYDSGEEGFESRDDKLIQESDNEGYESAEKTTFVQEKDTHGFKSTDYKTMFLEKTSAEKESSSIIPPPNEFANANDAPSIDIECLPHLNNSMDIILDDFEAQAVNDLHENVMNTFSNPLAQVTYYTHATEFNQYLSAMLNDNATTKLESISDSGSIISETQNKLSKDEDKSRKAFRHSKFSSLSSDQDMSSDSCMLTDNIMTQDDIDLCDSSEVSSVVDFSLSDLTALSAQTHWRFVTPQHSDSIEVNLSDDSGNSGYDSSDESGEKSDETSSVQQREKQTPESSGDDAEVSNFLFRLSSNMETFLKSDKKHTPEVASSSTGRSPSPFNEQDTKKIEFKKQNRILPLVLQNSLTGSSYPASHPDFIDELKDNALEEEEELKDELREMGSNISRHSGKGLSGRRTQSSGNLCNGKLVTNVGKLLVPCTKQGDELTSPNRYKLCASLPNYLEKENLDDLEPCKFPYGINNNNNQELEFYDIKKELDFSLKPILRTNSRSGDYGTKERNECQPERSPDEERPPDILQDRGAGEEKSGPDQQICQVHPFINQNSSTFLVCIEKGTRGLGLSVMGGCDTEDHLIRIKRIFPHTPAAQCGVLCQGDVILTVNDVPLTGLTNYEALEVLRMTYNIVHLKVYRPPDVNQNQIPDPPSDPPPPPPKREGLSNILVPVCPAPDEDEASREFDIVLTKHNGSLGFTLRKEDESVLGHYVRALVREPALSDGRIHQGDKIVAVNGVEMSRMSHEEAVQFLRQCGDDVRLRLYRDATQTPVAALSPCRQHKQLKPILRKEAMDMLSDLAVKKLSPQPSTNSSRSSSPRCRKLKPSSEQNNQAHPDSRVLSPTRPDSLDFNSGEKKTRYQFSSPESDTGSPSSCSSNSSSIASQILPPPPPTQAPPPMLDEPASLPSDLASSPPPPLPHSQEPASMPPLFASSPDSLPYFLVKDTDDPYKASMDLSQSKCYPNSSDVFKASMDLRQSKGYPNASDPYKASMDLSQSKSYPDPSPPLYQDAEPSSMPPLGSESFTHGNPSYQSTIPVSSKKLEAKLENGVASIPDLPAMLSPPPAENSKGLLKWKGVVFSPDESGDQMDSIKPPLAFSVSSDGDDQIVVVELNRGWNSRLGFSLADGPEASTVISAIHADSVASRDGRLRVGDQIVMVNDESVEAMSTPDIIDLLRKIRGSICIRVHRKNKVKSESKEL